MQLYNLSIQTNPKSAHAYYLRGLLKEQMGDLNRAIADWQRCLARLRTHGDAFAKLLHYERPPSRYPAGWRLAFGAATLVALITLIGIWILLNDRSSDHGTRAAQAQHGTER